MQGATRTQCGAPSVQGLTHGNHPRNACGDCHSRRLHADPDDTVARHRGDSFHDLQRRRQDAIGHPRRCLQSPRPVSYTHLQVYAGFRINIADDLSGQRDLFSEFAFGGLDAERPDYLPRLIIVSGAPEPGTFALVGAAVLGVVATRRRKIATPAVCRHSPRPLLPGLTCR